MERLGRGYAWLDTGTHESLLEAGRLIKAISTARGPDRLPEEIALNQGWITPDQTAALAGRLAKTEYGRYLLELARERGPDRRSGEPARGPLQHQADEVRPRVDRTR